MKQRRHLPGAVVMDGKLYVAGGYDPDSHTFLSSVEVFDDVSQKWYTVSGMGHERADLQLVRSHIPAYIRLFLDLTVCICSILSATLP